MSSLNLFMHDEKDQFPIDPYSLKTFAILRDYLEPDTQLKLESTASSILNLLPENDPHHGIEVGSFSGLCIEMAEQIPYHHPSQLKLVELLAYIGISEKLGRMSHSMIEVPRIIRYIRGRSPVTSRRVRNLANSIATSSWGRNLQKALMVGAFNSSLLLLRCSRLLIYPNDMKNRTGPSTGCPLSYYVNFHAFAANLFENRIFSNGASWAIWAMRKAHEEHHKETGSMRDMYVLAAAQWILWYGQSFFKHIIYPGEIDNDTLRSWKPGSLYTGTKFLSLHRWQFWKDSFKNIVCGGQDEEKGGYSQECRSVSAKAADIMDALEKNMTF